MVTILEYLWHACMLSHVQLFCNPMDCSLPGSSLHGIFQARILEWVAISSSRGSSLSKDRTRVSCISCIGRWVLYYCGNWEATVILVIFKVLLASWLKVVLKRKSSIFTFRVESFNLFNHFFPPVVMMYIFNN